MRAIYAHVCKPRDKEKIRFSTLLEYRSVSVYLVIQELSTWIHTLLFFYFMTDLKFCVLARHSVVTQSTAVVVFSKFIVYQQLIITIKYNGRKIYFHILVVFHYNE